MTVAGGLVRVPTHDPTYAGVADFLHREAELLDRNEFQAWTELLDEELRYVAPVRLSVARSAGLGFNDEMYHFDDTFETMRLRVRRLCETDAAWAETPPSRTRRFVTNIRVRADESRAVLQVDSYLLVTRSRWDAPEFALISCERQDRLRVVADGLRLLDRRVLLDQSNLGTINLALFL